MDPSFRGCLFVQASATTGREGPGINCITVYLGSKTNAIWVPGTYIFMWIHTMDLYRLIKRGSTYFSSFCSKGNGKLLALQTLDSLSRFWNTLPQTSAQALKNGAWKTTFILGRPIFRCSASFGEGKQLQLCKWSYCSPTKHLATRQRRCNPSQ